MAVLIKSGEAPNAAGTLTYGLEGSAPAFSLDSAGNLSVTGTITGGGGASGFVPLSTVTTKGDLIAATASATVTRVGVGTNGQVLTANSGAASGVAWTTPSADVPLSTVTTKGDVIAATGSAVVTRVAVGTDGQILTANSGAASGLAWTTPSTDVPLSTVTTKGDLIAATASATVARVGVGTNGQVLTANSGVAAGVDWETPTAAVPLTTVTTKGDLIAATASATVARVGVGTDGQVLTANSGVAAGIDWETPAPAGGDAAPPSLNGLIGWNFDHLACNQSQIATAGTTFYHRVILPAAVTVTNIVIYLAAGGVVLTTGQNFAGLYNSTGTRLAVTADQTTNWASTQVVSMPLVGGAQALAAGTYYVAILANGTTGPRLISTNDLTNQANMGQAAPRRFNRDGGGNTSLPSSVTLSGLSNPNVSHWVGLS